MKRKASKEKIKASPEQPKAAPPKKDTNAEKGGEFGFYNLSITECCKIIINFYFHFGPILMHIQIKNLYILIQFTDSSYFTQAAAAQINRRYIGRYPILFIIKETRQSESEYSIDFVA